jgi:hypothetical protein
MSVQEVLHIPLGSDCSLAYNLQKFGLRKASYLFDWSKVSIKQLIEILDKRFFNFLSIDEWDILEQSDMFPRNLLENLENAEHIEKSRLKIKHKKYGVVYPHESNGYEIDMNFVIEKFRRRMERLIVDLNSNIKKKIYVGSDKIKSDEILQLNETLIRFGCKNYELIVIDFSKYQVIDFSWKREYVNWNDILCHTE